LPSLGTVPGHLRFPVHHARPPEAATDAGQHTLQGSTSTKHLA
jgi:hypothetical protein